MSPGGQNVGDARSGSHRRYADDPSARGRDLRAVHGCVLLRQRQSMAATVRSLTFVEVRSLDGGRIRRFAHPGDVDAGGLLDGGHILGSAERPMILDLDTGRTHTLGARGAPMLRPRRTDAVSRAWFSSPSAACGERLPAVPVLAPVGSQLCRTGYSCRGSRGRVDTRTRRADWAEGGCARARMGDDVAAPYN